MNVFQLLAEQTAKLEELHTQAPTPDLTALEWDISGNTATANVDELGKMGLKPAPDNPGKQILVAVLPPRILPIINRLHEAGWKRTSSHGAGPWWILSAYLERDGARLRVFGGEGYEAHEDKNPGIPFFADPPPPLRRGAKALAEYRAWEQKCFQDEW